MKWSEFTLVLKPSPLGGVGVFAAENITAGTMLLRTCDVRTLKVRDLPSEFAKYCIFINDEESRGPSRFDHMEIGWFINHSHTPNIALIPDDNRAHVFEAIADISTGDEILLDYNSV